MHGLRERSTRHLVIRVLAYPIFPSGSNIQPGARIPLHPQVSLGIEYADCEAKAFPVPSGIGEFVRVPTSSLLVKNLHTVRMLHCRLRWCSSVSARVL